MRRRTFEKRLWGDCFVGSIDSQWSLIALRFGVLSWDNTYKRWQPAPIHWPVKGSAVYAKRPVTDGEK